MYDRVHKNESMWGKHSGETVMVNSFYLKALAMCNMLYIIANCRLIKVQEFPHFWKRVDYIESPDNRERKEH